MPRSRARRNRPDAPPTQRRSARLPAWVFRRRFISQVNEPRPSVPAGVPHPAQSIHVYLDHLPGGTLSAGGPASPAPAWAVSLVYELLDAHWDTARLVEESAATQTWEAHLDYLRALQCRARQLLARSASTT